MAVCRESRVTMPINRSTSHTFSCKRVQSVSMCMQPCSDHKQQVDNCAKKEGWQVHREVLLVGLRGYGCIWSQSTWQTPTPVGLLARNFILNVPWWESAWKRPQQWEYCLQQNHSLVQYAVTCQCLIIHKYLHFASQLFYVKLRFGDWKAKRETHSNTSNTR